MSKIKKNIPWFTIGTIGIIVTAIVHIFVTLFFQEKALQVICLIIYLLFIICLAMGFWKLKEQKNEYI